LIEYIDFVKKKYGEYDTRVLSSTFDLVSAYHMSRDQTKADSVLEMAEKLQAQIPLEDDPHLAISLRTIGSMKVRSGDTNEGISTLKSTLEMERRLYGDKHIHISLTLHNLVGALVSSNQWEEAQSYLDELIAMQSEFFPDGHLDVAVSLEQQAEVFLRLGSLEKAEEAGIRALAMTKEFLGANESFLVAKAHNTLGHILQEKGDYSSSESHYLDSIDYLKRQFGPQFPTTIQRRRDLALLYARQGQFERAESILKPDYEYLLESRGNKNSYTELERKGLVKLYEMWEKPSLVALYPKPEGLSSDARRPH